jgi:hypothetical protein
MRRDRAASFLSVFLVLALVGWFWHRGEHFIAANGPTFDEGVHLAAGYAYWTTGDFKLNAEDPPLMKLLWTLPLILGDAPAFPVELAASTSNHWQIADEWLYRDGTSPLPLFDRARRVNLAVGCCVVLLTGWWAYRIWGSKLAALAVSGFAAADPTLLSLSCILSTDVGLTFFGLLTCYLMWEYVEKPSRGLLIGTGIVLGLLLATKFSAVGIVAGFGVAGLVHLQRGGTLSLPRKEQQRGLRPAIELAIRLGAIAFVTVAATYAFIHYIHWAKGLKFQLTRGSHGGGTMYLNGAISRQGWYHYFLVALLVKLPLGLLITALISSAIHILRFSLSIHLQARSASEGQKSDAALRVCGCNRNLWLIAPPLVFFALASYSRVDMGIRVVLPVLPFFYLLAGGLARVRPYRPLCLCVVAGCLAWCTVEVERTSPHELSYFNELARVRPQEKPIVADSNLDWGQGLKALKNWMDSEQVDCIYLAYFGTDRPEAYGIRFRQLPAYGRVAPTSKDPLPGNDRRQIVAVSVNHLYGLFLDDPNLYSWLRERTPVSTLDGSIHLFDLTGNPEAVARVRALSPQ